jgi:hypothetical protein
VKGLGVLRISGIILPNPLHYQNTKRRNKKMGGLFKIINIVLLG